MEDIDETIVQDFKSHFDLSESSTEETLKARRFLVSGKLTKAALLLFGKCPLSNPIYQAVRVIAEEFLLSVTISSSGLKNRRQYKERKFEMRFIDDVRRYKWSATDINCSNETMEIVNRHKTESRKLYRQEFGNGMAVEYIGK